MSISTNSSRSRPVPRIPGDRLSLQVTEGTDRNVIEASAAAVGVRHDYTID